ncbi:MAG: hypothetical protein H6513_03630 [Acidimicrobiaceae bacterium]|nr:hypothetical protein [Ilumatobacter sp.]MCB9379766.1 hypothetical protein [Acidimicrobiaceae bacterium]MCO5329087.1 penicillin-binding transpeptidase domain-containing protein [Ilumatobacteraceae bacterium]
MALDKRSRRLGVLATVSLLLLGLLGARLWFLQGTQADEYQAQVTSAKRRTVYIAPERGRIFDADGRVVADNKRILTVTVDWSVIRRTSNRNELFARLSGPLQVPIDDLQRRYNPCYPGGPSSCNKGQLYDTLLPLPLKEDVSEDIVAFIKERSEDYPGVDVIEQYKRVYPYAPLASHVVGFMGAITAETKDVYLEQGYKLNERVGQFGVELSMERELHGWWGKRVYEVDASGAIVREIEEESVEPIAGFDIQLSIDLDIQQYAEQALETELRSRRDLPFEYGGGCDCAPRNPLDRETNFKTRVYYKTLPDGTKVEYPEYVNHKAPAGAVVVMNHQNGQVLAMASYPTFDNRWMEAGISSAKYQELFPSKNADGTPLDPDLAVLVNRAVSGNYNLGSTIKPFVAWSAIHAGIITPSEIYDDQGTYTLEGIPPEDCQNNGGNYKCVFKNATCGTGRPCAYGTVATETALAVSSDAYFYRLGEKFFDASENTVDQTNLLKVNLERFGFGIKTGIQLPYEWGGRIPDDEVKRNLVERGVLLPGEAPRLLVGDEVQVAIGQGLMAATPLQMAVAYSTIANGGFRYEASILKAILAPLTPDLGPAMADIDAGEVVVSFDQPKMVDQLESDGGLETIVAGLRRVIRGPGQPKSEANDGIYHHTTGELLFAGFPGFIDIAGKTGTAQGAGNLPWNDSSAFAAFGLPAEDGSYPIPYTVVAYLEKSGYGAKAAAPVTKCLFLALTNVIPTDPVVVSDTLDLNSNVAAPPKQLVNTSCLGGAANATKG